MPLATTQLGRINVNESQMTDKVKQIHLDLLSGMNSKEVANKHKVELAQVMRIRKRFQISTTTTNDLPTAEQSNIKPPKKKKKITNFQSLVQNDKPVDEKKKGFPSKIDDDTVLHILEDAESGQYTTIEIAKRNSVSVATVYNYFKQFNIKNKHTEQNKNTKPVVKRGKRTKTSAKRKASKPKKCINSIDIDEDTFVTCICQSDGPTKNYIFTQNNFCGFYETAKQDEICMDYIKNNIHFVNGVPEKDLVVYTKGFISVTNSIVKACALLKVNLTMLYIDKKTDKYVQHIIFDHFDSINKKYRKLRTFVSLNSNLFTYNCTKDDIVKAGNFYVLTEKTHVGSEETTNIILLKNQEDAMELYIDKVKGPIKNNQNDVITVDIYLSESDNESHFFQNILKAGK